MPKGAVNGGVLTSDSEGNSSWQVSKHHGTVQWSSIYKCLDLTTENNFIKVIFPTSFAKLPTISLTKEADSAVTDIDLYIKDKTLDGFQIYNSVPMTKKLSDSEIGQYKVCSLGNNGNNKSKIGICYYNLTLGQIEFVTNDKYSIKINDGVSDEICDMIVIGDKVAVFYIDDNIYKCKYSSDINATSFGNASQIMQIPETADLDSRSIFALDVNSLPFVFFHVDFNPNTKVMLVKAKDLNGTWGTPNPISDLTNHHILDAKIIRSTSGEHIIVIAMNLSTNEICSTFSVDLTGNVWSKSISLTKDGKIPLYVNDGKCSHTLTNINGQECLISSELDTNSLYISILDHTDKWSSFRLLLETNTTNIYPHVFTKNNIAYMLYNDYSGSSSKKKLVEFGTFENNVPGIIKSEFINSLEYCSDHQVVNNGDIIMYSDKNLTLLKFYSYDLKINWIALS